MPDLSESEVCLDNGILKLRSFIPDMTARFRVLLKYCFQRKEE